MEKISEMGPAGPQGNAQDVLTEIIVGVCSTEAGNGVESGGRRQGNAGSHGGEVL